MNWSEVTNCLFNGNSSAKDVATLNCIPAVFSNLLTTLMTFAGAIAVLFIIIAGIRMIIHGEDAKKIEEDKNVLKFAIAGLLLILLSFFIINIIAGITGAQCIKQFGFDNCK